MSVQRYRYDPSGECFNEHERGNVVFWKDHQEIVDKHERVVGSFVKNVEGLSKTISALNDQIDRLTPSKQHKYLVQWWYFNPTAYMSVKSYDELDSFLSDLAKDSSIITINVSALNPVKVTSKKVLTVEL